MSFNDGEWVHTTAGEVWSLWHQLTNLPESWQGPIERVLLELDLNRMAVELADEPAASLPEEHPQGPGEIADRALELAADDVRYAWEVRNRALKVAAEYLFPGPDGEDELGREALIRQWLEQAHDEVAYERPTWSRLTHEIILLRAQVTELREFGLAEDPGRAYWDGAQWEVYDRLTDCAHGGPTLWLRPLSAEVPVLPEPTDGSAMNDECPVRGDHMLMATQDACPACGGEGTVEVEGYDDETNCDECGGLGHRSSPHVTHVERDSRGHFYWWCEAQDCPDGGPPRYRFESEAEDAGRSHEARHG
ncbi:MAG: hypothetical protein AB7G37_03315 [Solirubrobacteraceae bacterium]